MLSAKKIKLIPPLDSNQIGTGIENNENQDDSGAITSELEKKTDKIKKKIYDKIHRFIKIILQIAKSNGYDNEYRIKTKNGKYLDKSNLVDLLTQSMTVGKVLYGENEFIELLSKCGVDPELIINDNVRLKLIQMNNSKTFNNRDDNDKFSEISANEEIKKRPMKRTLEQLNEDYNDVDDQKPIKKRKREAEEEDDSDSIEIDKRAWDIVDDD